MIEVDRPNRQVRRLRGKSDTVDAVEAARAVLSGRASGVAKTADGNVEAMRALLVAKRSGREARITCLNQIRHLGFCGPDELRERFRGVSRGPARRDRSRAATAGRRRPGAVRHQARHAHPGPPCPRPSTRTPTALDAVLAELVAETAPSLLELHGVSVDTAAILLVAAGDNAERVRSEAAWAHLCGVAPLQASSGKTTRHRLNRGGNRQANHALWRIVFTRMGSEPRTRAYVARRLDEGRIQARDHAHPQALRRPRGLPPPPTRVATIGTAGLAR